MGKVGRQTSLEVTVKERHRTFWFPLGINIKFLPLTLELALYYLPSGHPT